MKNLIYIVATIIVSTATLAAQQLPYSSQFNNSRSIWNPAATAYGSELISTFHMRQQWIGFGNAPRTGYASSEYPLLDYNMSAGAALSFDKTGPVSKVGLNLNYAYKLSGVFTREGQLSAGIGGGFSQYTFDPSNAIVTNEDDPLLAGSRSSTFYPSVTAGVFYISNPKMYDGGNVFFMGASYSQAYAGDVLVGNLKQDRFNHIFFEVGTRIQSRDSYFEPSMMLNYTSPEISTLIISGKYEMRDAFWAGLGYSSASDVSIQGGYILPEAGSRNSKLRLGALANYGLSDRASEFGLGFEVIVSYEYDLD